MPNRVPGAVARWAKAAGGTRSGVWLIKRVLSPAQRIVYRRTHGRVSLTGRLPVLLLTTTGRRSGKQRTVPVFYLRDNDRFVICNVRPPGERVNPWVINISADPDVLLEVSGTTLRARARPATEAELTDFWPQLVGVWPAYADFAASGGHRSVFILEGARAPKAG
jgi:deazaflavin-dependent oxidoreductase (nitroreductase family)